ncbi:hypothetical protein ACIA8C_17875 [Nocardia sp. NPDC051321]|uniref:hypothetical protein n=1 Tax=Nocardia sp. NPDC051321 TaxID=3364323 RepID=UPI00379BA60A
MSVHGGLPERRPGNALAYRRARPRRDDRRANGPEDHSADRRSGDPRDYERQTGPSCLDNGEGTEVHDITSRADDLPVTRSNALIPSPLSFLAPIASQAAAVTAVLYYFGWAYSRAFFGYFGLDVNMLSYSTQDYLLRSLNGAFYPATVTLFVIVVLISVQQLPEWHAIRSRRPRRTLRRWVVLIGTVGAALLAVALLSMLLSFDFGGARITLPLLLIAGAILVAYAGLLRRKYPVLLRARRRVTGNAFQIQLTGLIALIALGYLWAVGAAADHQGHGDAQRAEAAHFVDRSSVLIFSTERLAIEGAGATVGEITAPGEKYRYVYSGLWLLAATPDRYFLIPQRWSVAQDRVFIVRDSDTMRIDIARNP